MAASSRPSRPGRPRRRAGWLRMVAAVPAAILPLLPSATCPLCVAAYVGVLSSLGLGFLARESVLAPLVLASLAIPVLAIAWSTRRHRRPGPLALAVAGALVVVAARVLWSYPAAVYAGIACLLAGSVWNLLAKRRAAAAAEAGHAPAPCDRCTGGVAADGAEGVAE